MQCCVWAPGTLPCLCRASALFFARFGARRFLCRGPALRRGLALCVWLQRSAGSLCVGARSSDPRVTWSAHPQLRFASAWAPSSDPHATHPVRRPPAPIRMPPIRSAAPQLRSACDPSSPAPSPFCRREPQTLLFGGIHVYLYYTYTYTHICMCTYVYVCTCVYIYVYVCTCVNLHMRIHTYVHIHVYLHIHMCMHVSVYLYVCTLNSDLGAWSLQTLHVSRYMDPRSKSVAQCFAVCVVPHLICDLWHRQRLSPRRLSNEIRCSHGFLRFFLWVSLFIRALLFGVSIGARDLENFHMGLVS